jgi:threonine synthase
MIMKLRLLAVAVGLALAGNAYAFHCPKDMKKIDDALAAKPNVTAAQMTEVKRLRAEGETLHKQGKHQESVDTLAKAMKILNIQ